eukprot:scaffold5402_cov40-Tisochrysis_lutea.AAC.2
MQAHAGPRMQPSSSSKRSAKSLAPVERSHTSNWSNREQKSLKEIQNEPSSEPSWRCVARSGHRAVWICGCLSHRREWSDQSPRHSKDPHGLRSCMRRMPKSSRHCSTAYAWPATRPSARWASPVLLEMEAPSTASPRSYARRSNQSSSWVYSSDVERKPHFRGSLGLPSKTRLRRLHFERDVRIRQKQ